MSWRQREVGEGRRQPREVGQRSGWKCTMQLRHHAAASWAKYMLLLCRLVEQLSRLAGKQATTSCLQPPLASSATLSAWQSSAPMLAKLLANGRRTVQDV